VECKLNKASSTTKVTPAQIKRKLLKVAEALVDGEEEKRTYERVFVIFSAEHHPIEDYAHDKVLALHVEELLGIVVQEHLVLVVKEMGTTRDVVGEIAHVGSCGEVRSRSLKRESFSVDEVDEFFDRGTQFPLLYDL